MNVYVINRSDRPERLRHARAQLSKQNLNARRFEAIIDTVGWRGCRDSHISLLEQATPESVTLILEDDMLFLNDFFENVPLAMAELPSDWDCLYLGASPQKPQEVYSEHLYRINHAWCMHGVMWRKRKGGAVEYMLENRAEIKKIDVYMSEVIHPNFNCFLIKPMILTQSPKFNSDTCKRADLSTIEKNYQTYCK